MLPPLDIGPELAVRLARHEVLVHARAGREVRDLGDGILLFDAADPEPFWNRLVAPHWPVEPAAFDRRLDEIFTVFATMGRLPHVRTLAIGSQPPDAETRLVRSGFRLVGRDRAMALADPGPALALARTIHDHPDLRVEHVGSGSATRAMDVARVLVEAFDVESDRIPALAAESLAAARRPGGAALLLFERDRPVAAARRVTVDGATYLSSIGTIPGLRRRGYASLLTAIAITEAVIEGTSLVHLLAEAGMPQTIRLYERLGFESIGDPIADLLSR